MILGGPFSTWLEVKVKWREIRTAHKKRKSALKDAHEELQKVCACASISLSLHLNTYVLIQLHVHLVTCVHSTGLGQDRRSQG